MGLRCLHLKSSDPAAKRNVKWPYSTKCPVMTQSGPDASALRRLGVCIVAGTAQRGGEPEIIDDDVAQTVCRQRRLGIAANDVFEVGQDGKTLRGTERLQARAQAALREDRYREPRLHGSNNAGKPGGLQRDGPTAACALQPLLRQLSPGAGRGEQRQWYRTFTIKLHVPQRRPDAAFAIQHPDVFAWPVVVAIGPVRFVDLAVDDCDVEQAASVQSGDVGPDAHMDFKVDGRIAAVKLG